MTVRYFSLPCQFCGISVLRNSGVKKATCIECKLKRVNAQEKLNRAKRKKKPAETLTEWYGRTRNH